MYMMQSASQISFIDVTMMSISMKKHKGFERSLKNKQKSKTRKSPSKDRHHQSTMNNW